jgi:acetyl esterase/lipase
MNNRLPMPLYLPALVAALSMACSSMPPAEPPVLRDIASRVDPELRELFAAMPPFTIEVSQAKVEEERRMLDEYLQYIPRSPGAVDRKIPGPPNAPEVRVRIYRPTESSTPLPALLWFHGGAWTFGKPEMDEAFLQRLADEVPMVVASVDYRLAPEHPFPAAHDDGHSALQWLRSATTELVVDPDRIFVGGSSSGANLAAGLAIREQVSPPNSTPKLAFQLLFYPVLDSRLETRSMRSIADPRTITREFMQHRWRTYLGESKETPPEASPALAVDLEGLAPAAHLTAELDPLRDEAISYAQRLWESGVACDLHVFRGAMHGFDVMAPDARVTQAAFSTIVHSLRRAALH